MRPFDASRGQQIFTQKQVEGIDHAFIAHFQLGPNTAATCVVKAASAQTDKLTIAGTSALGARFNPLSVLLQTNTSDALAVTKNDTTGVITVKLAKTTAGNNTAAAVQAAIRALSTVKGVDVLGVTCTAAGNWDTAAIATGETGEVDFSGGISDAEAASNTGVHAARTCPAIFVGASCEVKAASAVTDILTTALPAAIGEDGNALSLLLATAGDDSLAVTKNDGTGVITVALAKTTAAKNTAALIQAAIRALSTVAGVDVSGATCTAGGNWDTAAIATGETGAVDFAGGISPSNDVLTTGISNPFTPRNITATAGGTGGDIKAVQCIVHGTNYLDEVISETLPAFTVNTPGTVVGNMAFKTVTSLEIPPHDGLGATTAFGWGDKIGLPFKLHRNNVLYKQTFLNNTVEGTEPAVTVDAVNIEGNTIDLNSALNGTQVDTYMLVSSGAADS